MLTSKNATGAGGTRNPPEDRVISGIGNQVLVVVRVQFAAIALAVSTFTVNVANNSSGSRELMLADFLRPERQITLAAVPRTGFLLMLCRWYTSLILYRTASSHWSRRQPR